MRALRSIIKFFGFAFILAAMGLFIMMLGFDAEYSEPIGLINCLIASLLLGAAGSLCLWFENLLREADEEWYARHPELRPQPRKK